MRCSTTVQHWATSDIANNLKACVCRPVTRLLNWIGGCRWGGGGVKTWPCHIALAHAKYTLSQYTLLKTFKCIPCCNIVLLVYTLSDWGCWADKQKKKSSPPPGFSTFYSTSYRHNNELLTMRWQFCLKTAKTSSRNMVISLKVAKSSR